MSSHYFCTLLVDLHDNSTPGIAVVSAFHIILKKKPGASLFNII